MEETTPSPSNDRGRSVRAVLRVAGIFIVTAMVWGALTIASPYFLTWSNILNILLQSSTVGMLAAGLTVVLIAGEIDISIASVQALAGTMAAWLIVTRGLPVVVGVAGAVGVAILAGAINAYATICVRIPSFIVTLAMLGIAEGVAFLLTGGVSVGPFPHAYTVIGQGQVGPVAVPVIITGVVYVVLHFVLSQTSFGHNVYAVGGSRNAARISGLRIERTLTAVFILSGVLAGLAGVMLSAQLSAAQGSFGANDLLYAVAAVVIGGTSLFGGSGTVVGTLAGVIIIGTINDGIVLLNVQAFWSQVVVGVVILGAVMVDQMLKGELPPRSLIPWARTNG